MPITDPAMIDETLLHELERLDQRHVLHFWDELTAAQQANLVSQLSQVDWNMVGAYCAGLSIQPHGQTSRFKRIAPPAHVVRTPQSGADLAEWNRAFELGAESLRAGKVAAVLLAGGQGTRLGFDHPKGMFPIGPVTQNSLFQILAEQVVALTERYKTSIPYLVMTSEETHDETVSYFESHQFFGLNRDELYFFQQGYSPCVDCQTGKLLLASKGTLQLNPDGHGGLLAALLRAGLLDELRHRGVEYLFSHQIDNPLVRVCDPALIGMHIIHQAQVSTKVVAKTCPEEKVGVAVDLDGKTSIIEYCDLTNELANEREPGGGLRYWAGSTAIHVLNRDFMEAVATSSNTFPWHHAVKKIPFTDARGELIHPVKENGVKFERFLFDTLPLAKTALVVETIRSEEFAPLKNQSGDFSAEYVRRQMINRATKWLNDAGIATPPEACVEISPRFASSPNELKARAAEIATVNFGQPVYLGPETVHNSPSNQH